VQNGVVTLQTSDSNEAPDPFDPLRVDPRFADADTTNDSYYLKPLLLSAGLDEEYDISAVPGHDHAIVISGNPPNDPYYLGASVQPGTPINANGAWADNITNHFIEPQ
jgi:hypothetical protein